LDPVRHAFIKDSSGRFLLPTRAGSVTASVYAAAPRRTVVLLVGIALAGLLYAAYVVAIGFSRRGGAVALAPGFAGSAACAGCHRDLVERHARSAHARSLQKSAAPAVTDSLPPPQWLPDPDTGAAYRIGLRDGQPGVEVQAGAEERWIPTEWAFGSGTHAHTFVGRAPDGSYVESPVSFYRSAGWDFTVGFLGRPKEERAREPEGRHLDSREVLDCFQCHTAGARLTSGELDLHGAQLGVQCESCHGPSKAHVEAARKGRPREGTVTPGRSAAQSEVTFCASCHRDSPPPGLKVTDPVVVRFAPVGLQQSRCFRESGKLSCGTCHDPHGGVSRDPDVYRLACMSCHSARPAAKVCPVRPQGDCVSCHMPRRIVQRNTIFTDHWIRVVRASERGATSSAAGVGSDGTTETRTPASKNQKERL
jgi:hypothetical protein